MNVVDSGSDLLVECDYNADLFDRPTIRRWLSHYENLLRGSWPSRKTPSARCRSLGGRREAWLVEPRGRCRAVVGMPARAVRGEGHSGPDRVAVVCGGESLTSASSTGGRMGWPGRLQALGVGPDVLVGLRMRALGGPRRRDTRDLEGRRGLRPPRSGLSAGSRRVHVGGPGVQVVVTRVRASRRISRRGAELVVLDRERDEADASAGVRGRRPTSLAYVMYTSGSTGKPKGVLDQPRQRDAAVRRDREWFGFGRTTCGRCSTRTRSTSPSGRCGARCCTAAGWWSFPYWVSRSPEEFRELLVRRGGDGAQPDAVGVPAADRRPTRALARP